MKTKTHRVLLFLIVPALAPTAALAVDGDQPRALAPAATADAPQTGAVQSMSAASMHVLRERMQQIRRTGDPEKRMQLIEAQMNQLDRLIQDLDGNCPMMDLPPGMMGRNGLGATGGDPMLAKRLEMMEKRMDMMQMMLQRQNDRPGAATAPPGSND